jgi:pimeloyl-ACP methyl ester carboxylesterase
MLLNNPCKLFACPRGFPHAARAKIAFLGIRPGLLKKKVGFFVLSSENIPMRKGWWIFGGVLVALVFGYLLGPHPSRPAYDTALPSVPAEADALDQYVASGEALHKVKPNNEARIIWYDTLHHGKTPLVLLYLHGFSASQEEGNPVHLDFAARYGCNLFLSRLSEHGLDTPDAMVNLTADGLWNSAKQAYAIARQLGDSVIIMGTSTGGTLALQLAATYPNDPIKALLLLSPNIAINNPAAWLLNDPWGLQIARGVMGSKYFGKEDSSALSRQYWNTPYRLEALVQLEEMLETKMIPSTFEAVRQPTLLLYYYKDELHQDPTVKVSAEKKMFDELGTPPSLKRAVDIPNAGGHVLGSYITSHDLPSVKEAINTFAQDVLHLRDTLHPEKK